VFDIVFGEQSTGTLDYSGRQASLPSHLARPAPREERARMDEAKNIIRLNIEHYKRLLATESDPHKLETITRLLAEQEAKLQEIERKERGD